MRLLDNLQVLFTPNLESYFGDCVFIVHFETVISLPASITVSIPQDTAKNFLLCTGDYPVTRDTTTALFVDDSTTMKHYKDYKLANSHLACYSRQNHCTQTNKNRSIRVDFVLRPQSCEPTTTWGTTQNSHKLVIERIQNKFMRAITEAP